MASDDLVKYFIEHTNDRFDQLEKKVDRLISFRAALVAGAGVISVIVSAGFQLIIAYMGGK